MFIKAIIFPPLAFFRYLYEFLYGWLISAYNRADSFLTEHQSMTEYLKNKAKASGGAANKKGNQSGGSKSAKHKKKDKNNTSRPYARDIAYCQAVQSMCGGYYKVSVSLLRHPICRRRTLSASGASCSNGTRF